MKLKKKYFVGKNRPGIWASVYAYKPNDKDLFAKRGEIFAAVLLEGPDDFESSIAGNLLLDILHETYFESSKKSTLEALEEAVRAVKNRLISLVENDDSAAISGINFDLVTVVVKNKFFYSVRIGDGVLKVYRNGNLQDLSAGYKDPTGVGDFEVLSSYTKAGDVMFLSTPDVSEEYSHDEVFEAVNEYSEIGLKNKMMEDDSKIAFLMLGLDLDEVGQDEGLAQGNITDVGENDKEIMLAEGSDEALEGREEMVGFVGRLDKYRLQAVDKARDFFANIRDRISGGKGGESSSLGSEALDVPVGNILPDGKDDQAETSVSGAKPAMEKNTFMMVMTNIRNRSSKILKEIYLFVKKDLLAIEDQGIFLKGRQRQMNYRVLIAVIILVVIVLFGAIKLRQDAIKDNRIKKDNEKLVQEIESKLEEISTSSVFSIPTPDNISARENVHAEIIELKEKIDSTEIDKKYEDRIASSRTELDDLELQLLRVVQVEPVLLSDLGAVFEGAQGSDITIASNRIFVSDSARNVIYEISKSGGEDVYFDEDLNSPRFISGDPNGDLLVLDGSSTALGLIDLGDNDMVRFPGMSSDKFTNAVEMETYKVSDNDIRAYFAMSVSPQVQQVSKNGSAYSSAPQSRWDSEDLAGLTDISLLDGKFIMTKTGEGIVRYYVNSKITTNITGLLGGDNINSASAVATDALYIYVADPTNHRILVFTKSRGENVDFVDLVAQFKYESDFSDIKDIAVDGDNIYVLDGSKVYKLAKSDFQSLVF